MSDEQRSIDRAGLRRVLAQRWPWLRDPERGPTVVDAGECDRCGRRPRVLPTCGPVAWTALCRTCGPEVGPDAWCDGHATDGEAALAWAVSLPHEADDVVRLWWVATGEVRLDPSAAALLARRAGVPELPDAA